MMHVFFILTCLLVGGCVNSDTIRDAQTDRKKVVKETILKEGVEGGQPVNTKQTLYREEVSEETAHSEQSRSTSVSLPDGAFNFTTGVPALDAGLLILSLITGKKGFDKMRAPRATQAEKKNV